MCPEKRSDQPTCMDARAHVLAFFVNVPAKSYLQKTIVKGNKASLSAPGVAASSVLHDTDFFNFKDGNILSGCNNCTKYKLPELFSNTLLYRRSLSMKNNEGLATARTQLQKFPAFAICR